MTAGAAIWWKNVCLYLDSINVLRNANGKINLKEEQTLVVSSRIEELWSRFSISPKNQR